jgi:hypothetical protein
VESSFEKNSYAYMPKKIDARRNEISPTQILGGGSQGGAVASAAFVTPTGIGTTTEGVYRRSVALTVVCAPRVVTLVELETDVAETIAAAVISQSPWTFEYGLTEPSRYTFDASVLCGLTWTATAALQGFALNVVMQRGTQKQEIAREIGLLNKASNSVISVKASSVLLATNDQVRFVLAVYNSASTAENLDINDVSIVVARG